MSNVVALFPNRPPPEPDPAPAPAPVAADAPVERAPHVRWWGLLLALPLRWLRPLVRGLAALLVLPSLIAALVALVAYPAGHTLAVALGTAAACGLGGLLLAGLWDAAIDALEAPR